MTKAKDSKAKKSSPSTKRKSRPGKSGASNDVGPQNKGGRPSKYSANLIAEICERLSVGEPLAAICRDEKMPAARTVREWKEKREDVSAAIAQARDDGWDYLAADCLNIADDNGKDTRITMDGNEITDHDVIQRSKLRVDTRLKLLAKWNPKKYGDKLDLTTDGDKLQPTVVERVVIDGKSK